MFDSLHKEVYIDDEQQRILAKEKYQKECAKKPYAEKTIYALYQWMLCEMEVNPNYGKQLLDQLLELCENHLDATHQYTLAAKMEYGKYYGNVGDFDQAIQILEDVYEIVNKRYSSGSLYRMVCNHLAWTYSWKGIYDVSNEYAKRVYDLGKEVDRVQWRYALYYLAYNHIKLGNMDLAKQYANEYYLVPGPKGRKEHFQSLRTTVYLSDIFASVGEYVFARDLVSNVYQEQLALLSSKHSDVLRTKNALANYECQLGNYREGFLLFEKNYKDACEILGENHRDTLEYLASLSFGYQFLQQYDQSIICLEKAYNAYCHEFGEMHPNTISVVGLLGQAYRLVNRKKESIDYCEKAYVLANEVYGRLHSTTLDILYQLVEVYSQFEEYRQALKYAEQVLQLEQEFSIEETIYTLYAKMLVVECKAKIAYTDSLRIDALEICDAALWMFDEWHPLVLEIMYRAIRMGNLSMCESYLSLSYNQLFCAFQTMDTQARNLYVSNLQWAYGLLKEHATIEKYTCLLRFKNIAYDLEYAYIQIMKQAKVTNYVQKLQALQQVESDSQEILQEMESLKQRIRNQLDANPWIAQLRSCTVERLQETLDDDSCMLDVYAREADYAVFFISSQEVKMEVVKEDILEPFREELSKYSHIYLALDGDLWKKNYADEVSQSVSYVSTPKMLLMYENKENGYHRAILVGDLEYTGKQGKRNYGPVRFSGYELQKIKQCFLDVQMHTKSMQKLEFLQIQDCDVLHVSAHGNYQPEGNLLERGQILLSNEEIVHASDILYMHLPNAFVSLATCESGIVENEDFSGVYGLRRAFELAGARTLLVTNDKIQDLFAATFMVVFYQELKKATCVLDAFVTTNRKMESMTIQEVDAMFGLTEGAIREKRLGFVRKEMMDILNNPELCKKELHKFMLQGFVK